MGILTNDMTINGSPKSVFLMTPNDELLKLEYDNSISLNGEQDHCGQPSVQFYVEKASHLNVTQEVFVIRPVSKSNEYLAVSGSALVLKESSQVHDNSHCFIVVRQADNIHIKLQVYTSPSNAPTFISYNNEYLFIAEDSIFDSQRGWFDMSSSSNCRV